MTELHLTELCFVDPAEVLLCQLRAEIARARGKHPGNKHRFAALVEEVGEVARALHDGEPWGRVIEESLHVACAAVRLAAEGDPEFEPRR